jgi:hypothetical protein
MSLFKRGTAADCTTVLIHFCIVGKLDAILPSNHPLDRNAWEFSDEELLGEIIRRRRETQDRFGKLSITAEGAGKSSRKSQATAQYWQGALGLHIDEEWSLSRPACPYR